MSKIAPIKFPSGRSIKRLKQDAKVLVKENNLPLYEALNIIALKNGGDENWANSIKSIENGLFKPEKILLPESQSALATELGITDEELDELSWEIQENASNEGLIYDYIIKFEQESPPEILRKITGLTKELTTRVGPNAFDDDESFFEEQHTQTIKKDMNPYRKLLVMGINELLERKLLTLDWDGGFDKATHHFETTILGHKSIIIWSDISHGEVRVSIWWKYDHSKHPQANASGNAREEFKGYKPLARKKYYPNFVGVVCSGWLERKEGLYLQGVEKQGIIDRYMRKGELEFLKNLPNPIPLNFKVEGQFHM